MSLPSWERGLKSVPLLLTLRVAIVAPLVGARIEICHCTAYIKTQPVAPLVGARIEIALSVRLRLSQMSLPSWERGLKSLLCMGCMVHRSVAPLVGARIEIEKTIVYNVLCDYIEGGHLIEQDG